MVQESLEVQPGLRVQEAPVILGYRYCLPVQQALSLRQDHSSHWDLLVPSDQVVQDFPVIQLLQLVLACQAQVLQ